MSTAVRGKLSATPIDIRIHHAERNRLDTAVLTEEFTALSGRVQLGLEVKFGGPAEALKQLSAIKYDCFFHATEFCRTYNKPDTPTRAYQLQEYVVAGLEEKAIKIANKSKTLANALASN